MLSYQEEVTAFTIACLLRRKELWSVKYECNKTWSETNWSARPEIWPKLFGEKIKWGLPNFFSSNKKFGIASLHRLVPCKKKLGCFLTLSFDQVSFGPNKWKSFLRGIRWFYRFLPTKIFGWGVNSWGKFWGKFPPKKFYNNDYWSFLKLGHSRPLFLHLRLFIS